MVMPWRKAICPFCFHRFYLTNAPFRLTAPTAPKEEDEHIGRFLSMPAPQMGEVVPSGSSSLLSRLLGAFFDDSSRNDRKKICPHCHMSLPYATASGQLTSNIVAIVGARGSGKSNYFGVLLHALETRYAADVGFTMYDQDTFSVSEMRSVSSKRLYRERYGNRLFGRSPMAIDQNRSAQQDRDLRIPLIYRLEFRKRPIHYLTRPLTRVIAMDLVIFDAAGEDMEDPVALEQFCSYILRATGIIFVIDPFQIPCIRSHMTTESRTRFDEIEVGPAEIVSRVINLFESRRGLRVGQRISVPVAFTFAKSDVLKDVIHPTSRILRDGRHNGGFDASDCRIVSEEVMECLREWGGSQLIDLARRRFRSFSFFAVSALGQTPDASLKIPSVSPVRVADPLLWLLWKHSYVPTKPS